MKFWWNSLILMPFLVIFDRYFDNSHESYISRVWTFANAKKNREIAKVYTPKDGQAKGPHWIHVVVGDASTLMVSFQPYILLNKWNFKQEMVFNRKEAYKMRWRHSSVWRHGCYLTSSFVAWISNKVLHRFGERAIHIMSILMSLLVYSGRLHRLQSTYPTIFMKFPFSFSW